MSNRLLSLVLGADRFGPPRSGLVRRLVMIALADRVHGDGDTCYPGLVDIAARTELALSTLKYALVDLKAEGWLSTTRRHGYGTVYRLNVAKLQENQREPRYLRRSTRLTRPEPSHTVEDEPALETGPPLKNVL